MCRLQVPNICRTYSMWSGSTFSLLLRSHWCATHATTQRSTQCQDHVGLLCSASATVALVHGRPQMQTEQNDNLCQPEFCLPPPPFYFTPRNRISFTARSKAALLKLLTRPRFHHTTTMPVIMCILAGKWHRTHHRTVPPVCLVLLGLKTVTRQCCCSQQVWIIKPWAITLFAIITEKIKKVYLFSRRTTCHLFSSINSNWCWARVASFFFFFCSICT